MGLVIPESVLEAAGLTEQEARRELAVLLYSQERLSEGQAAELADMDRWSFNSLLAERAVPMHYGVEDLNADLERAQDRRERNSGSL